MQKLTSKWCSKYFIWKRDIETVIHNNYNTMSINYTMLHMMRETLKGTWHLKIFGCLPFNTDLVHTDMIQSKRKEKKGRKKGKKIQLEAPTHLCPHRPCIHERNLPSNALMNIRPSLRCNRKALKVLIDIIIKLHVLILSCPYSWQQHSTVFLTANTQELYKHI